ncbi:MAG TPA: GlsB/YeaQ/YmgE family stress response membrane protein [Actinomycetota bacterium]|nr:GlsB/YeaQ/YmgE family stress response membrane protein [Actinomycetota bacterium]
MVDVIVWLIVGLVAGAIARLLVPGEDPMGILGTMLLGLVGSVLGGLVADLIVPGNQRFEPAGLIGSILGGVVVLLVYRWIRARRAA